MATLKDHQQAMVDLLASGSGIPASASRLAHAMHDLIAAHLAVGEITFVNTDDVPRVVDTKRPDATTPGLNDKALAADVEACQVKLTGAGAKPKSDLFARAVAAERRVKELENTVKQLRTNNAKLRNKEIDVLGEVHKWSIDRCLVGRTNYTAIQNLIIDAYVGLEPEQAGVRKDDTQVCEHEWHDFAILGGSIEERCVRCGVQRE